MLKINSINGLLNSNQINNNNLVEILYKQIFNLCKMKHLNDMDNFFEKFINYKYFNRLIIR